jgi:hypothetical protein
VGLVAGAEYGAFRNRQGMPHVVAEPTSSISDWRLKPWQGITQSQIEPLRQTGTSQLPPQR